MKMNINCKKLIIRLIIMLMLSSFLLSFANRDQLGAVKSEPSTVDEYVTSVINKIESGDWASLYDSLALETSFGYDPALYSFEAIRDGINQDSVPDRTKEDLLTDQIKFIQERFGEDAWEKATYSIKQVPAPEQAAALVYINNVTGNQMSEEEYFSLVDKYYEEIRNGVSIDEKDYTYLIEQVDIACNQAKKNGDTSTTLREDFFLSIASSMGYVPPVEIHFKDLYDYYVVSFTFDGKTSSLFGESSFRIDISTKEGQFQIANGFRWDVPLEYDGDV